MPFYNVKCPVCKTQEEVTLKVTETIPVCPNCNGARVNVMSPAALNFVGPGFYVNDYPDADHAVGRKAEEAWGAIYDRNEVKNELSKYGDVVSHALDNENDRAYFAGARGIRDSQAKIRASKLSVNKGDK